MVQTQGTLPPAAFLGLEGLHFLAEVEIEMTVYTEVVVVEQITAALAALLAAMASSAFGSTANESSTG